MPPLAGDLKRWTTALIGGGADTPKVHSVSYGWQGELSAINCADAAADAIDLDLAKVSLSPSASRLRPSTASRLSPLHAPRPCHRPLSLRALRA